MTPEEQHKAIAKIRVALEGRKPPIETLVVEDDTSDAEITISRIRAFGLIAHWARDTVEVQNYLSTHNPWLTFLDLKLGDASGINVLDWIKSVKPDSRVVILTGAFQHDSEECKESLKRGAIAVMLKPLTEQQIQLIFGTP